MKLVISLLFLFSVGCGSKPKEKINELPTTTYYPSAAVYEPQNYCCCSSVQNDMPRYPSNHYFAIKFKSDGRIFKISWKGDHYPTNADITLYANIISIKELSYKQYSTFKEIK